MALIFAAVLLLCWSHLPNANGIPHITTTRYDICEDIPQGEHAFTIAATNPGGGPLTYSISGLDVDFFRVEASDGRVFVKKGLDREAKSIMDLVARVSDSTTSSLPADLLIVLMDANDNRPIFEEASYETSIPENTAVGTTLFKVLATDKDSGPAGSVTYSVDGSVPSSGQNMFRIDTVGNVILDKQLNYTHLSTFYRLEILARDNGGKCYSPEINYQSSSVFAFITVEDVPDLDPQFFGTPYIASVEENSLFGTSVIAVSAIDPDTGINDDIIYTISDSSAEGLFSINENGIISVKTQIDRETIGDTVTLTVTATETNFNIHGVKASATAQVRITIIDLNDNTPQFYKCVESDCIQASSFTGEVLEHSLGAVFINMTVKDADKNAETILSLEGDGKDLFSVQPPEAFSDSDVQLVVKNLEDLDYETIQQVTLQVIAVDKGNPAFSTTADVTIKIIDTNDHSPVFPHNTYSASVPEHCEDGTEVIVAIAEDPDTMDQGAITYSLLPTSILPIFDVDTNTGRVYVKNGTLLDREVRSLYSVTLQARDTSGKPGSAVLEITITDINDKTPVPNREIYQEFVFEGKNLENVKIEASDGDEPDTLNSQLVYTIEPGPYSDNFTINPDTGDLTNKGPLDREHIDPDLDGKIDLSVKISDKGSPPLSTVVQVVINVQDVNDNKPEFEESFYNFTVKESDKGASVGSVYAEDHDQTPEFNRISFSIVEGSFGSFMIISEPDAPGYIGKLQVDQDVELDYDSGRKNFILKVEATDLDQQKAEVTVEVHVLDVNDERPEFKPIPSVEVEENSKETGPVGKFDAVDKDTNSSLVYELESVTCMCGGDEQPCDWFVLEPNGEVKINPEATIDYESCNQAIVEAQVVDEYTEKGESNSAAPGEMVINIKDVNDNTPEFISSNSLFVVVSESASQGTSVAAVTATDRDSGANAEIDFDVSKVQYVGSDSQTPDTGMPFEAITTQQNNIYVGIIQTTEKLNTDLRGKYVVTVQAKDKGGLANTTELEIFLVNTTFQNVLKFESSKSEVENNKDAIMSDLTVCTQAAVHVVSINEDKSKPTRESAMTAMVAYFVYGNGTAVHPTTVKKDLSEPDNVAIMYKHKLVYVDIVVQEEPEQNTVLFVLFGLVGGLIVVTAVLTTSLLCSRRNFRRKLKAANAMKSASTVMSDQKGGPVVPGTNLYTMEGANPVLNLNIDTAIALDLGEDSDVDKVSLNSLDNSDDVTVNEKDTKPILQKAREDKDNESGPPGYIEPLGVALAQRDQKIRSNNPLLGDTNPMFDTTDL